MNSVTKKNKKGANQNGNALFLILIAVVLFAALSYAVVGSSRSGGDSVAEDKAQMGADILMNYTAMLRQNITRMMISNNLQWWEIDFSADPLVYTNLNCSQPRCKLFHPDGGNMPIISSMPEQVLKTGHSATVIPRIQLVVVENIGTSEPEIILKVQEIASDVCAAINEKSQISPIPLVDSGGGGNVNLVTGGDYVVGGNNGTPVHIGDTPQSASAVGKDMGCGCKVADCSNGSDSRFWAVLYSQ